LTSARLNGRAFALAQTAAVRPAGVCGRLANRPI
jgi:hypothetical protein